MSIVHQEVEEEALPEGVEELHIEKNTHPGVEGRLQDFLGVGGTLAALHHHVMNCIHEGQKGVIHMIAMWSRDMVLVLPIIVMWVLA